MSDQTIALLTGLSAISDFNLKAYSLDNSYQPGVVIGVGGYALIAGILSQTLSSRGVAYTNNMWNVGTSILETGIAIYKGEKLTQVNLIGIAFVIVGAYLLRK
jgi:multidrug transporter EmrE-like cation transporter